MTDSVYFNNIPDVRDGLNKKERAILYCLQQTQQELGNRNVPTVMLYGRVVELVDISQQEFQTILARFVGMTRLPEAGGPASNRNDRAPEKVHRGYLKGGDQ